MSKLFVTNSFRPNEFFQKDLNYFLAVSQTLNFSKAAENLGVQQPALSRSIQKLESELGQKLFIRKNMGLQLTTTGLSLVKAISETQRQWHDRLGKVLQTDEVLSGMVNFGFHASFGQNYLPKILNLFSRSLPKVEINFQTMSSFQVIRKVLEHELQFGIVVSRIKNPELVLKKIGEDYLASYQSTEATKSQYLVLNPEMQSLSMISKKFKDLRRITIPDYDLIAKSLINSGHVGVLPHSVAQNYPRLKQTSGVFQKADLALVTHKENLRTPAIKAAFELIYKSCLET